MYFLYWIKNRHTDPDQNYDFNKNFAERNQI